MFFTKKVIFALLGACLSAASAVADDVRIIPVGELCAGFAGPVPNAACVEGSQCCMIFADFHLCAAVEGECPTQWIDEGETCGDAAGPAQDPCVPGTTCCYTAPDHAHLNRKNLPSDVYESRKTKLALGRYSSPPQLE
ncbi:hypothetical protein H1R20_g229, partial [Candolleomyces eurysporus]